MIRKNQGERFESFELLAEAEILWTRRFGTVYIVGPDLNNFFAIYIVLVVKIVFRIVIFRKNFDGDPTKITKMPRKIDLHVVIAEKM